MKKYIKRQLFSEYAKCFEGKAEYGSREYVKNTSLTLPW